MLSAWNRPRRWVCQSCPHRNRTAHCRHPSLVQTKAVYSNLAPSRRSVWIEDSSSQVCAIGPLISIAQRPIVEVDEDPGKNRRFWAGVPIRNSKDDHGPSFPSLRKCRCLQPLPPKLKIPSCAYKYLLGDTTTGAERSRAFPAALWLSRVRCR